MSTPQRPKQFLPLVGEQSLYQATLDRVSDRKRYQPPIVVANAMHRELCAQELGTEVNAHLILEPCARNTAAAIVMAAQHVHKTYGQEQVLLVMPSDHLIGDIKCFHRAVALGSQAAARGSLVTFGITPTAPETGYGYLEAGAELSHTPGIFEVAAFVEKPQLAAARQMVATGRFYWNGGIFMFRAGDILGEASRYVPEILGAATRAMTHAETDQACIYPSRSELEPCPNISIDYAIMERSDRVTMVPLDADWSDVGSWDALADIDAKRSRKLQATAINSPNCYVRTDGIEVALLGVEDLVVVSSGNQVLVMRKGHSQDIRELAARLAAKV
jgi:mannose-1-phosphate guanylyltransferase/mannose-1-phosphate guanylyltransferase/mannose-6-phosphate isomerase